MFMHATVDEINEHCLHFIYCSCLANSVDMFALMFGILMSPKFECAGD